MILVKTGQVTLFIIIGIVILIIVASLIYALPRVFVPVATEPLPINLQRCIDDQFSDAIRTISESGGASSCIHDTVSVSPLSNKQVCYGLFRSLPIKVEYSQNLFYGKTVDIIDENRIRNNIRNAAQTNIETCSATTRNFNVELTDTQVVLRFDLRRSSESSFERFESRIDVPLKQMILTMQNELSKARNRERDSIGDFGLTHKFSEASTLIDSKYGLESAYISEATNNKNHLFYLQTTNKPLSTGDGNVILATIIEDRYPVVNYPSLVTCDGNDYENIIDPDEGQRNNPGIAAPICEEGVTTDITLVANFNNFYIITITPVVSP
jgi:hypothetical protein